LNPTALATDATPSGHSLPPIWPQACHHCFELVIIIFCFICTAGSFALLESDVLKKERDEAGPGTMRFLMFLFAVTIVAVILTIKKLIERWRNVSTDVFVSEV